MRNLISFCLVFVFIFSLSFNHVLASEQLPKSQLEETVDKLLGVKYKWGGITDKGFDCSGFTSYVFKQLGYDLLRTSKDQSTNGEKVAKDDLRAGDLVFFNTNGKGISHVGIYLGDGEIVHADWNEGIAKTNLNNRYYAQRYVTAVRILNDEDYVAFATVQE